MSVVDAIVLRVDLRFSTNFWWKFALWWNICTLENGKNENSMESLNSSVEGFWVFGEFISCRKNAWKPKKPTLRVAEKLKNIFYVLCCSSCWWNYEILKSNRFSVSYFNGDGEQEKSVFHFWCLNFNPEKMKILNRSKNRFFAPFVPKLKWETAQLHLNLNLKPNWLSGLIKGKRMEMNSRETQLSWQGHE